MRLNLEQLESKDMPSSVSVIGGQLLVSVDGGGTHTVSVDNAGGAYVVTLDGQTSSFDKNGVNSLKVTGDVRGVNIIQNNTSLSAVLTGGNLSDTIFGGAGANTIDPGRGDDVVYALLGTNTISTKGDGFDRVFTNFGASVTKDLRDELTTFFMPGRTPGAGSIGVVDGVLYIAPTNNGSFVSIDKGPKGQIQVTYDLGGGGGTQVALFAGVSRIAYFGGTGSDTYINNTTVNEAAYGSAGNDSITSGLGDFSLLKGSGGNDTLTLRAKNGDVSGNGGADLIIRTQLWGQDTFRVDALDTVIGAGPNDVFISP